MADATVAARLRGGSFSEPHSRPGGAALDDLFDDPVLRSAFGRAAGLQALEPHGLFEQRRLGLRRWEWAPYGLYAPVCADRERAQALAEFDGYVVLQDSVTVPLLAKSPLTPETARMWAALTMGELRGITAFDSPDSIAIAEALAKRKGPLSLPNLKKISPKTLTALLKKEDVEIPLIETLELIQEPDGSLTEDFVIPESLEARQPRLKPDAE